MWLLLCWNFQSAPVGARLVGELKIHRQQDWNWLANARMRREKKKKACRKVNCRHQFIHKPSKANEPVESEGSTARINNRTSQFRGEKNREYYRRKILHLRHFKEFFQEFPIQISSLVNVSDNTRQAQMPIKCNDECLSPLTKSWWWDFKASQEFSDFNFPLPLVKHEL
jgi:hypothetical protein